MAVYRKMEKPPIKLPPWMVDRVRDHLHEWSKREGILPTWLLNPCRKDRGTARRRRDVIVWLTATFSQHRRNAHKRVFALTADVEGDPNWKPLSRPVCAEILDMNQSTITLAIQKMKRNNEQRAKAVQHLAECAERDGEFG